MVAFTHSFTGWSCSGCSKPLVTQKPLRSKSSRNCAESFLGVSVMLLLLVGRACLLGLLLIWLEEVRTCFGGVRGLATCDVRPLAAAGGELRPDMPLLL